MVRLVVEAAVRVVGRCVAVAELLRRRLVSLRLRVDGCVGSTLRGVGIGLLRLRGVSEVLLRLRGVVSLLRLLVVAVGWLMVLVVVVLTVKGIDSSGEKSESKIFHSGLSFSIIKNVKLVPYKAFRRQRIKVLNEI